MDTTTILFIAAFLAGFMASAPLGPVNLWIAHRLIPEPSTKVMPFIWGVILIDLLYAAFGFIAYFFLSDQFKIPAYWHILGGILMISIGLWNLFRNRIKVRQSLPPSLHLQESTRFFVTGVLLCASNVALSVLWAFIASIFDYYHLVLHNYQDLFWVVLGVTLGDLLWFNGYASILKRGSVRFSLRSNHRLQTLLALALVLFGLFTACSQL